MCMYAHVCICVCVFADGGQRKPLAVVPRVPLALLFEMVFLIGWELMRLAALAAQGFSYPHLLSAGIINVHYNT